MKYVTKFLCALAITTFISSCASSGSGCYDFGDNTKINMDTNIDNVEIVFVARKDNKIEDVLTICGE
jgi:hypothetical protein